MTIRDNVKVYHVPFTLTARGKVFVIADSPEAAARAAANFDLGDFLTNDEESISIGQAAGLFLDVGDVVVENKDLSQIDVQDDYDVDAHPDYDPSEHDEEEETSTEEPK